MAETLAEPQGGGADVKQGVPDLPGFVEVPYQLEGARMKPRVGYFHLATIPDPMVWLETNLGPVVA